jgi:predicted MFS family arabinose efflux permease
LLALGGLVALAVAMGVGRFVYTPILPFMLADLGLSEGQAGLIASANFAGYLIGALLAATPKLPGTRRTWLIAALAVSALTTAAIGLGTAVSFFLLLRFLGGVASAFVLVFASTLVLERLRSLGRGELSALHFAGVGVGIACSAVFVSALAALDFGWRWQWLVAGLASALAVLLVARLIPEQAEPPLAPSPDGGSRGLMSLVVAYGLFGFGYIITATFLVAIVRASDAVRPLEPVIWLVVGLAAVPSVGLWIWVGRRIGVLRAFALACGVEALGVAASVLWITPAGVLLAAALLGGTFVGITALGLVAGRQQARGDPRRVLAVMTAAFGLGQIIGPALAGALFDATGSFVSASLTAVAALITAALLVLVVRRPA